jgi:hypothetical protein
MEENGLILPEVNSEGQYVVQIKEEFVKTGGHFQAQSFQIEVPSLIGIYEEIITFPIGIGILNAYSYITEGMIGDELECIIGENTIVGVITNNVSIDDDIINVSPTVIEHCDVGYYINLFNGSEMEELGRIIEKDVENNTIKTEFKSSKIFNVATPTYIRMCIKLIPSIKFCANFNLEIGYKKTGTNYLPKNTTFIIRYNNKNATSKVFSFILEYLY